jgi:hypothetical protein
VAHRVGEAARYGALTGCSAGGRTSWDCPLDAVLLARGQYSESPATGHLDTGFSWFSRVFNTLRTGIFFLFLNHKSLIQSKVTFF